MTSPSLLALDQTFETAEDQTLERLAGRTPQEYYPSCDFEDCSESGNESESRCIPWITPMRKVVDALKNSTSKITALISRAARRETEVPGSAILLAMSQRRFMGSHEDIRDMVRGLTSSTSPDMMSGSSYSDVSPEQSAIDDDLSLLEYTACAEEEDDTTARYKFCVVNDQRPHEVPRGYVHRLVQRFEGNIRKSIIRTAAEAETNQGNGDTHNSKEWVSDSNITSERNSSSNPPGDEAECGKPGSLSSHESTNVAHESTPVNVTDAVIVNNLTGLSADAGQSIAHADSVIFSEHLSEAQQSRQQTVACDEKGAKSDLKFEKTEDANDNDMKTANTETWKDVDSAKSISSISETIVTEANACREVPTGKDHVSEEGSTVNGTQCEKTEEEARKQRIENRRKRMNKRRMERKQRREANEKASLCESKKISSGQNSGLESEKSSTNEASIDPAYHERRKNRLVCGQFAESKASVGGTEIPAKEVVEARPSVSTMTGEVKCVGKGVGCSENARWAKEMAIAAAHARIVQREARLLTLLNRAFEEA